MRRPAGSLLALLALTTTTQTLAETISTDVVSNGGCEGAYFDITTGARSVLVTAFETNQVGTADASVYYRGSGGYSGFENDAGEWTLLGSQTVMGGSGFIQTLYPLDPGDLVIPANSTFGILVYSGSDGATDTLATRYGVETSFSVTDTYITVSGGAGSCGGDSATPFDGSTDERAWRGVVEYTPGNSIGGTVSGLEPGASVTLANDGNELVVTENGPFTFAEYAFGNVAYSVTVATQPTSPEQVCTVDNAAGTLAGEDITDVSVACATPPAPPEPVQPRSVPMLSYFSLLLVTLTMSVMGGCLSRRRTRRRGF